MRAASYLDTSFLIKLYVTEPGSAEAVSWFRQYGGEVVTSSLTDVEVAAALYQKLPAGEALQVHEIYRGDCALGVYGRIAVDEAVFAAASNLVMQCAEMFRLRSLDAIHLECALRAGISQFATYDARLAGAATSMGLTILPARS
jgi:predicted nucleic acid-binding protein